MTFVGDLWATWRYSVTEATDPDGAYWHWRGAHDA